MIKIKFNFKKTVSVIATLATLLNSLGAPVTVLAQEITPSPTPTDTAISTATPTVSPTPLPTDTPTPVDVPTPTPVDTTTPSATLTPVPESTPAVSTPTALPTDTPNTTPTDQPTSQTNQNQTTSPTISPTVSPTPTTQTPVEHGVVLSETIINGIDLSNVTGLNSNLAGQGSITTNQADYAPTGLVLITGTGFIANKTYTIVIVSVDAPPVNFTDQIKADSTGKISYAYQLDGNYRPNYTVFIKDGVVTVATITFTDSSSLDVYSQCANGTGSGPTCSWTNGDLNNSNSRYFEGDSTVQRLAIKDLTTGDHTVTIQYDTTQGGKHAYDYITDDLFSENWVTASDLCSSPVGNFANCSSAIPSQSALIPADPNAAGHDTANSSRHFSIRNGTWVNGGIFSGPTLTSGNYSGNSSTNIQLKFHVDSATCVNSYNKGQDKVCEVLITFGAHVSTQSDWGIGNSAVNISGSPYHVRLQTIDGGSSGSHDNQMAANAVIPTSRITIHKVTSPAGGTGFGFSSTGGLSPSTFSLNDGGSASYTTVVPGTYTISENDPSGSGYGLSGLSCGTVSGSGTTATPSLGNRSVSITIGSNGGGNVDCTFTNSRSTGTIKVIKNVSPNDNGATSWDFAINGPTTNSATLVSGGQSSAFSSNTGSYSITENAHTGTDANNYSTTYSCLNGSSPVTSGSGTTASFTLASNQNIVCTFTNTRNTGDLQVIKVVDDGSPLSNWSFSLDGGNPIQASSTGVVDFGQVTTNVNHTITETGSHKSDYALTSIAGTNCTNNNDGSSASALVPNGGNTTCTFTNNVHKGTVNIVKYNDLNANGSKDNGEPGLSGWTIALSGNGTNTTDSNGAAGFTGVMPGNYTLSETLQNGWNQSNISCDNGTYNSQSQNLSLTVNPGQTVNCSIGNYQNAHLFVGKHVISPSGAEVTDNTSFAFTAAGNSFSLSNGLTQDYYLKPGTYSVAETANSNYTFNGCSNLTQGQITLVSGQSATVTCTNQQKPATITVQKSVVASDGQTQVLDGNIFHVTVNGVTKDLIAGTDTTFTVDPGSYSATESSDPNYTLFSNDGPKTVGSNGTATIHLVNEQKPGSISGYKFQSDNTTPIDGWTINLLNCTSTYSNCTQAASTTTAGGGFYSFTNLISGFYQVVEGASTSYTPVSPTSHNGTIGAGTVITDQNFSNFKNINITVCKKQDADGSLETTNDQSSVLGWDMTLSSDGNTVGDPQTTGDNGCTTFSNLGPGHNYSVTEGTDSSWTNLTPLTYNFGSPVDGQNQTHTFVNFHNISISGEKYNDVNGNGVLDKGEVGLSGWIIQLQDQDGNVLKTTTTDSNGNYSFANLGPGTYKVREVSQTGWVQMTADPSDIKAVSGRDVTNVNFGNQGQGTVVVTKYLDDNADGRLQQGEQVLSDWTINLAGFDSQTTDANGSTTFTEVPAGSHILSENIQEGWIQSNIRCDNEESFVINNNNRHAVRVTPGSTVNCYIGNYQNGKITVAKTILDPSGNPSNDTQNFDFGVLGVNTDYNNSALIAGGSSKDFSSLRPGTYNVTELTNSYYNFLNCVAKYEGNEVGNTIEAGEQVTVTSGDTVKVTCTNQQRKGTVLGVKWNDENQNRYFDGDEPGLPNWTIFADLNGNGQLDEGEPTTLTDSDGSYALSLNPGVYSICEVIPSGWEQTYPGGETQCFNHIHVYSGQEYDGNLDFGNFLIPVPKLDIVKSNDKSGGMSAGNTVNYTVSVTNNGNVSVNNLNVKDTLPGGFTYILGTSTLNGNPLSDPTQIGSNLTWNVGTLGVGATDVIKYQVLSSSELSNGTFTNFVTCSATYSRESTTSCDPAKSDVIIGNGTNFGGNLTGQVLGASTELPDTGSPTGLLALALGLLGVGIGFEVYNSRKGAKHAKK